jgi:hypothetical protein
LWLFKKKDKNVIATYWRKIWWLQRKKVEITYRRLCDWSQNVACLFDILNGQCEPFWFETIIYLIFSFLQEMIPLILCTATLHPDPKERDQLLNILFNLIKRPDLDQRWEHFQLWHMTRTVISVLCTLFVSVSYAGEFLATGA